jgi:hypothetical protein
MIRAAAAWSAAGLAVAALLPLAACTPEGPGKTGESGSTMAASPILPDMPRQRIVLMSSLPLVYGAGVDMAAVLAGKADPHPLHKALAAAHDLVVPDVLDAAALRDARLAILVQPRALAPDELVALDAYVRAGGRLLLFADPMLEWPRTAGLADPGGPVRSSLISPLLKHWGLELIHPEVESVRLEETGALLVHPGQFGVLPGKIGDADCSLDSAAAVARCQVGKGRALLVADADLLDPDILSDARNSGGANRLLLHRLLEDIGGEDSG